MGTVLAKIRYPKFLLLILTFALAYFILRESGFLPFKEAILATGYVGAFLCGVFFSYGFTAAPATAILLIMSGGQNPLLTGLIAGLGAMTADLIIFDFIRFSFKDELEKMSKEKWVRRLHDDLHGTLQKYLVPVLAGLIIASPLPDEIGVALLAASRHVRTRTLLIMSYVLNTAGIMTILYIGTLL